MRISYFRCFFYYSFFINVLFNKLYILLYSIFFVNIFFNIFLFLYNFLFYYQEAFFNLLFINIDFIQKNIFNYKYKLTENFSLLGNWPVYGYKTDQSTWIKNEYNESFLRDLIFFEFKNLYFFKSFFNFGLNLNRVTNLFLLIYFIFFFRISQYFLSFLNKWFFFIFFNNDWSIAFLPKLTWDRLDLFSKKKMKNYYFNEGFYHILGGNFIINYFYYFNNNLDKYIYKTKNQLLFSDKIYNFIGGEFLEKKIWGKKKLLLVKKYNNNLFFENQLKITKNLWVEKQNLDNFFNWKIISLLFFKNYQFIWYKNIDYIIFKYAEMYGQYNRSWVEFHNINKLKSLWIDKFNYIFLPVNGRKAFFDGEIWFFYEKFILNNRYYTNNNLLLIKNISKIDRIYYYQNLVKKNILVNSWVNFIWKKKNKMDLLETRLHYPFLMLWLVSSDLKKESNSNLKYLFPFLIQKKEIWLLYKDLFFTEKDKIESLSIIPMFGEWLTHLNKSYVLSYLIMFDRISYENSYENWNYKGVWNSISNTNRDLFNNYLSWDHEILKETNFIDLKFYKDVQFFYKIEFKFYKWLLHINKTYLNYYLPVFFTQSWFNLPIYYEPFFLKNLKQGGLNKAMLKNFEEQGILHLFSEQRKNSFDEPLTSEEWNSILLKYNKIFLQTEDNNFLMFLKSTNNIIYNIGSLNFIVGFLFFFIPFFIFVVEQEIYFELNSGFVYQGGLGLPFKANLFKSFDSAMKYKLMDIKDERYFFLGFIEHEIFDI